ncbi:MAG: glycerate kinase [Dysgonamonadaceae bacterium]|jgi:glycerate kinase|nr:glycerate kinase [Dysgonamonadaceae bacterium]
MNKIVIAIDSFKGCLSSIEAGQAASEGVRLFNPACETIVIPIADGGEGILNVLTSATGGQYISVYAHNPLMELIETQYGISGDGKTALIEMAAISGLPLVPEDKRNPMKTTTFGTGELIKDALEKGCREFIIGIGGSATNDAGLGMLQALGYRFLDRQGNELGQGGEIMKDVACIDFKNIHPALKESRFTVACDVNNPFYGTNGAAYVFARQKGAGDEMIKRLDEDMKSLSEIIKQTTGKDISNYPGSGAAGGMGGGFLAFLSATLKPGIKLMLDTLHFQDKIKNADFIITGEGRVDKQTTMGKVPSGILEEAKKQNIPVIVIAGGVEDVREMNRAGFCGVFSIVPGPVSLEKAMQSDYAKANITGLVSQICNIIQIAGHNPQHITLV